MVGELLLDRGDQLAVLRVDRADAPEQVVVARDLDESLARDTAAASDVLEERQHVVRPLRAAERDHQHASNWRSGNGSAPGRRVDGAHSKRIDTEAEWCHRGDPGSVNR